jgi:hypothetical protein
MYGYFAFELRPSDTPQRTLVIFCATADPRADAVISVIRKHGRTKLSPDRIILLGLASEQEKLNLMASDEYVKDELRLHTRNMDPPPVQAATIPRTGLSRESVVAGVTWGEIRFAGLATIFKTRNALLVAPSTHHFEKQSSRSTVHGDRFIRTANALVDGAEITFIAAMCLGFVSDRVQHFYCDTGGISVVAFAIDSLRRRFNHEVLAATVNAFNSYGGLQRFEFREPDDSIVLVSASTTGGLEAAIYRREKRFRPEQIVTLFSLGTHGSGSHVVLDLEEDHAFRQSLGDFTPHEHSDCPLCRRGSIAVQMTADQFIPVRSEMTSVLVVRSHAPPWLPRWLEMMAGRACLRAFYRSPNSRHAANDVFIDLERALQSEDSPLAQRVHRLVVQVVPSEVRRIIHLDDPASLGLAEQIVARHRASHPGSGAIRLSSASEIDKQEPLGDGASLVVASAVASGQALLAVSQILRNMQTNGVIAYVIALTRMATSDDVEKLERDLRMGEQPTDYGFAVAERINLPVVGRNADCSWNDELNVLQDWANPLEGELREILEARIDVLRRASDPSTRGLTDRLFWSSASGQELKLRDKFVFFPKSVVPANASQGDVYFTIACVLHHLRHGSGMNSVLRQTEYERRVLSPLCFDRFNDGVVQAALLRATKPPELDYSSSQDESQRMASILRSIFSSATTHKGEASREFLLSMAQERLILSQADTTSLYEEFGTQSGDAVSQLMWQAIAAK